MSTEAQKRASKKYRQNHLDYYSKKSAEYFKKCRLERNEYKTKIDKAIEFIELNYFKVGKIKELLDILQGSDSQ